MNSNGIFLICVMVVATAVRLPAQDAAEPQGAPESHDREVFDPETRQSAEVLDGERNPFGLVALPKKEEPQERQIEAETEEMKLRRILGNMRISGAAGMGSDRRVLLGSMMLGVGDTLPRLFADQAEVLKVQSISDREVTIAFVEKDDAVEARTLGLSFDLQPRVSSMMDGETFRHLVEFNARGVPSLGELQSDAVQEVVKGMQEANLENLVERETGLMGDVSPDATRRTAPEPETR